MWLSKGVYERVPQFYFLFGLLFVAGGLYLGFDFELAFYYIGFGLLNCSVGITFFLMRLQNRRIKPAVQAAPGVAAPAPAAATPAAADESASDSSLEHSAQH
jgi:hypothetical protein